MSVPALKPAASAALPAGLSRSAALMRALGAEGDAIWSRLSPEEARELSAAMQSLPPSTHPEQDALKAFVRDMKMGDKPPGQADTAGAIWAALGRLDGQQLASWMNTESPQTVAVTLAHLPAETAASLVRALPQQLATQSLQRLLSLGPINPVAVKVIAQELSKKAKAAAGSMNTPGAERVARIFDNMAGQAENGLLSALDRAQPGSGDKIKALMFTFDDLARLDPGGLQTLLSRVDRSVLALSLKGARPETIETFLKNMTARAREVVISEIEALGPVRRDDVEAARQELTRLAKSLVNHGDILTQGPTDSELIE